MCVCEISMSHSPITFNAVNLTLLHTNYEINIPKLRNNENITFRFDISFFKQNIYTIKTQIPMVRKIKQQHLIDIIYNLLFRNSKFQIRE